MNPLDQTQRFIGQAQHSESPPPKLVEQSGVPNSCNNLIRPTPIRLLSSPNSSASLPSGCTADMFSCVVKIENRVKPYFFNHAGDVHITNCPNVVYIICQGTLVLHNSIVQGSVIADSVSIQNSWIGGNLKANRVIQIVNSQVNDLIDLYTPLSIPVPTAVPQKMSFQSPISQPLSLQPVVPVVEQSAISQPVSQPSATEQPATPIAPPRTVSAPTIKAEKISGQKKKKR